MNASFRSRTRSPRCMAIVLATLVLAPTASAEACGETKEAPALFVDLFSSTRIYPNADAALLGFATGAVWRPRHSVR